MNPVDLLISDINHKMTETERNLDIANNTIAFQRREADLRTQLSAARALRDANNRWHDLNQIMAVFTALPLAFGGFAIGTFAAPGIGSIAGAGSGIGVGLANVSRATNVRDTYCRACRKVARLERELKTLRNAHKRALAALSDT